MGQPGHGAPDRGRVGGGRHAEGFVPGEERLVDHHLDGVRGMLVQEAARAAAQGGTAARPRHQLFT